MFLEDISATLFEMVTNDSQMAVNEILAKEDIDDTEFCEFMEMLENFGVFVTGNSIFDEQIEHQLNINNEESRYASILSDFQNELSDNGLFYSIHIDVTNRCNEKCIHCYHPFDTYDYSQELTYEQICQVIDDAYKLGVFSVTLSGGEALLRTDIFDIIEYISLKGMMITLFTNGTLLTDKVVQQLRLYRIRSVSISLYSDLETIHDQITGVPGSYTRTMQGIRNLAANNISFDLKCVVLKENIARIAATGQLFKELNDGAEGKIDFSLCGKINGDCVPYSHQASDEDIRKVFFADPDKYIGSKELLQRSPEQSPCGAGKYGLYCSADGKIFPCVSFRLFLCNCNELIDIGSNPILTEWRGTRIADFSECFKHDYCKYCVEQCAGNNLIENNDYLDSNISHCNRAKIIAEWFKYHPDNND